MYPRRASRHGTLKNPSIARQALGESGGDVGTTATYIKADPGEVAAAVAVLTGEPRPLAVTDG